MSDVITAIHVDDDAHALQMMAEVAAEVPNIWLKKSFDNTADALEYLQNNSIDLVLSDVEMPGNNGLWLANHLSSTADLSLTPEVVFVTSYAHYAIHAFEACALDYILKPIQRVTLQRIVDRFNSKIDRSKQALQINDLYVQLHKTSHIKRIFVNLTGHVRIVLLDTVLYFAASGSYTKIFLTEGETIVTSKSIKSYIDILTEHPDFVRIHRSYLVNKNYVQQLNRHISKFTVTMTNGDVLDVSQKRKDDIFQQITQ